MRLGRKHIRRWAVALLPALLLRSLIPVGFMPMFGPGLSISLMLCPAYAPVPTQSPNASIQRGDRGPAPHSMDMSMGMDMSMDMSNAPSRERAASATPGGTASGAVGNPASGSNPGHPDHQDHTLCPYAASATLAGLPTLFTVNIVGLAVVRRLSLPLAQINHSVVIARAHSARGPPFLA